jgi:hypothetical protein
MLKVVDQESHFRAVTRYRQVELKDDATVEKAGRRKGEGGATKEQRAKAAAEAEEKRVESIKLKAEQFADWLDDVADAKGLGQINGTSEFSKLFKSTEHAVAFMRRIAGSKGGEQ